MTEITKRTAKQLRQQRKQERKTRTKALFQLATATVAQTVLDGIEASIDNAEELTDRVTTAFDVLIGKQ